MAKPVLTNLEEELSKLSIEELLELENIILRTIKAKSSEPESDQWKKDFLKISTWRHLNKNSEIRVDKWKIETY